MKEVSSLVQSKSSFLTPRPGREEPAQQGNTSEDQECPLVEPPHHHLATTSLTPWLPKRTTSVRWSSSRRGPSVEYCTAPTTPFQYLRVNHSWHKENSPAKLVPRTINVAIVYHNLCDEKKDAKKKQILWIVPARTVALRPNEKAFVVLFLLAPQARTNFNTLLRKKLAEKHAHTSALCVRTRLLRHQNHNTKRRYYECKIVCLERRVIEAHVELIPPRMSYC